ncbi:hypothetical protein BC567DRAFT_57280 [Phyllosticta citribraziliensis]
MATGNGHFGHETRDRGCATDRRQKVSDDSPSQCSSPVGLVTSPVTSPPSSFCSSHHLDSALCLAIFSSLNLNLNLTLTLTLAGRHASASLARLLFVPPSLTYETTSSIGRPRPRPHPRPHPRPRLHPLSSAECSVRPVTHWKTVEQYRLW